MLKTKTQEVEMANVLSIDGVLKSLYDDEASIKEKRSTCYKEVKIGKPLVVRYLYFFIKWQEHNKDDEKVMITSFLKTLEEKNPASEAVNYFDPNAKFNEGIYELEDWGGQNYGHRLVYYNKAYLGESIKITTKIMELDKIDDKAIEVIKKGISTVNGFPMFSSFLPYSALASKGVELFKKVANIFNNDDVIISGHDLDLYFKQENSRRLQSGRIVCIPDQEEENFIGKYTLSPENRLIDSGGKEYQENSYFVLQVNNEKNKLYDKFDQYQGAAELLDRTNRGGNPTEFVNSITHIFEGANDMQALKIIEELSMDLDDSETLAEAKAIYKHMSSDMRKLFESRFNELIKNNTE